MGELLESVCIDLNSPNAAEQSSNWLMDYHSKYDSGNHYVVAGDKLYKLMLDAGLIFNCHVYPKYHTGGMNIEIDYDMTYNKMGVRSLTFKNDLYASKHNGIEKVIFNNPATIVIWKDGSKTVVKCQDGEVFDPEKGLAMAISRRFLGDTHDYYDVFEKWLSKERRKNA